MINCNSDIKCSGKSEEENLLKKINLELKKDNEFKDWVLSHFSIYEAEYNNLMNDFTKNLKLKDGRKISENKELKYCDCSSNIYLTEIDSLSHLFKKSTIINQETNLTFEQQEVIYNSLNSSQELNYSIQLTEENKIYSNLKTELLNPESPFGAMLQSYVVASKIKEKIYSSDKHSKKINWGKNNLIGEFKIRDLTNPRQETTIPNQMIFELNEYVSLESEYGKIVTNSIGILSENAFEKYSSLLNKKVSIEVVLSKDESGVVSHPLELNVYDLKIN